MADSSQSAAHKRKAKDKEYYKKTAKISRRSAGELGPGIKGFMCTSNREKDSVREAYNLLNEHAEILYGNESEKKSEEKAGLEIEDELSKEVAELKNQRAAPIAERRFQSVATGVKGCLFIRSTVQDPSELVDSVIEGIQKKQEQTTKFLLRMLPIHATCKTNKDEILKATDEVITDKLENFKTFSLIVKVRNHNLKRDDLIPPLADVVTKKYPELKVNLSEPEVSVVVEVLGRTSCIGIVTNYSGRAKYNLVELAQKNAKTVEKTPTEST